MTLPRPDAAFHWTHEPWGAALRCQRLDAAAQHLFTSKQLALPDDEAWRAALASTGSTPDRLMRVKQVHGNVVRDPQARRSARSRAYAASGRRRARVERARAGVGGDGGRLRADPAVRSRARRSRGDSCWLAGHMRACRRPTAIETMQREFAMRSSRISSPPSAQASDPMTMKSANRSSTPFSKPGTPQADVDRWFIRSGAKPHLDLWAANRRPIDRRRECHPRHIYLCGLSTVSHADIFDSYRVAGEARRPHGRTHRRTRLRLGCGEASRLRHKIPACRCTNPATDARWPACSRPWCSRSSRCSRPSSITHGFVAYYTAAPSCSLRATGTARLRRSAGSARSCSA